MTMRRLISITGLSAVLITAPAAEAQFGIKRKSTNFQDLQKEAAAQDSTTQADLLQSILGTTGGIGGGMGSSGGTLDLSQLQNLMAEALKDPETMKQLEQMGEQFGAAMEQLSQMTPKELEQQMQTALSMLTEPDMVDSVLAQREAILQQLEMAKTVPAHELARMKTDPEYFELKMRESFSQMKDIFADPEYLKLATEAMGSMKGGIQGLLGDSLSALSSDENIEEARLKLLEKDNPLSSMFGSDPEVRALLEDPKKFMETVKETYGDLLRNEL